MIFLTLPFLLDFIVFLVMLRVSDAAGREMHLTNLQAALLIVAYNVGYFAACLWAGHILTRRNSRGIFIVAVAGIMLASVPLIFSNSFSTTACMMFGLGLAVGFVFNSLQTFMRGEAEVGSLAQTIARYTFSWSGGIAFGFLVGGILKASGGPLSLSAVSVSICTGILIVIATYRQRSHDEESSDGRIESVHHAPLHDESNEAEQKLSEARILELHTRYVFIGWSLTLCANVCMRPLSTFMPKFLAEAGRPSWLAGTLLFSICIVQAVVGLQAYKQRRWLYRREPLLVQQALIVACFVGLWATTNLIAILLILMLLGGLFGFMFFWAVYYVSNHPRSTRNVGINEAMVAVGNILSVLVADSIINLFHNDRAYYLLAIVFSTLLAGAQWYWLREREAEPLTLPLAQARPAKD